MISSLAVQQNMPEPAHLRCSKLSRPHLCSNALMCLSALLSVHVSHAYVAMGNLKKIILVYYLFFASSFVLICVARLMFSSFSLVLFCCKAAFIVFLLLVINEPRYSKLATTSFLVIDRDFTICK
jgi:hypothetical protein